MLDIFPPRRGRARAHRLEWLRAQESGLALRALRDLLETSAEGVDLEQFARNRNLAPEQESRILAAAEPVLMQVEARQTGFSRARFDTLAAAVNDALERCHRHRPEAEGFDIPALRDELTQRLPVRLLRAS